MTGIAFVGFVFFCYMTVGYLIELIKMTDYTDRRVILTQAALCSSSALAFLLLFTFLRS